MSIRSLVAVCVVGLSLSCAPAIKLINGPMVPAAEGRVTVATGENGNTRLSVTVEHLALPEKVDPQATVYIVWVQGTQEGAPALNVGALTVDEHLTGRLETLTSFTQFELSVTAEAAATAVTPVGAKVLSATISRK
ncbi:MAG: hypothetical protein IAE78_17090 [Myxococcus sp.]|nr:hypothetical protein [Myxococcus sp.]